MAAKENTVMSFKNKIPFERYCQHNLSLALIYLILGISERASFLDF